MSSSAGDSHQYVPPLISKKGLLIGIWLSASLSVITLAMRLFSRFRGPKKLYADDWLIILGWGLFGIYAVIWQYTAPYIYIVQDVIVGNILPPETFPDDSKKSWQIQLIILVLFSTSLFLVKLSFLLLFQRLRRNVTKGQYLWWASVILTVSAYFVWIGIIPYKCMISMDDDATGCARLELVVLVTTSVLDVATDLLSELPGASHKRCAAAD
ncbi:hypothetical protein PG996_009025 [Apiospora saccharicola]|uniref:Rhodopsin domain-containing protein n=1 Tax=Apiospora saccharicola TaxID=335842 RepID=A0ABR1UJJ8_9PEZI